jgi:hypothetical protein
MNIEEAKWFLRALLENLDTEKCRQCECLQGMLVQLKLDWPELKGEADKFVSSCLYGCKGCKPCPPAELWEQ